MSVRVRAQVLVPDLERRQGNQGLCEKDECLERIRLRILELRHPRLPVHRTDRLPGRHAHEARHVESSIRLIPHPELLAMRARGLREISRRDCVGRDHCGGSHSVDYARAGRRPGQRDGLDYRLLNVKTAERLAFAEGVQDVLDGAEAGRLEASHH